VFFQTISFQESNLFELSGMWVVLEQPSSSLLFHYQAVQEALQQIMARKVSISMASFGGTSQKPLSLMGTAPWLEDLARMSRDGRGIRSPADNLCSIDDCGRVTGRRGQMKASEEYTPEFTEP
jgi:EAL domain-containing protein (putative c-di-GMP-specific phosphodiesterase class I)